MAEEPEDESTEARFRRVQEELRAMELPDMPDDEVDARLADIQSRSAPELPNVPQIDAQLRSLEGRARSAKIVHNKAKGGEPTDLERDRKASKGLGVGLAIAYGFLGMTMAGLGIGFLVDRATGSSAWMGLGTVAGAVAGIVFTIFLSNRENSRL